MKNNIKNKELKYNNNFIKLLRKICLDFNINNYEKIIDDFLNKTKINS